MITTIERDDDPRLEAYRHVGEPHWLNANGLFIAEGRLVVERLIDLRSFVVESVLVTAAAHRALQRWLTDDFPVYVVPQAIVNDVTGFNFHRGCLALARRPPSAHLSTLAASRRVVVLEGVNNPDNVGGIFRSAAALGADAVVLDPTSADPFYRKAIRTSMGATLSLPFVRLRAWPDDLAELRKLGYVIAALTPRGTDTVESFSGRLAAGTRVAVLAGAEGPGLTDGAVAQAHATVRIPIDDRRDSLNVVVAVSIALHRIA